MQWSYRENPYATHQPVLWAIAKNISHGRILELGAGYGSTPLLHEICKRNNNILYTIETKEVWARQFNHLRSQHTHQ